ncbi:unnamed protein product, partial [Mesorhabditis belari]|uniref:Uncharacterized protein n=1 Tax=Mesorhabditis belari TaxID=2138241 RepID=A0AAF3FCB1_9BILA
MPFPFALLPKEVQESALRTVCPQEGEQLFKVNKSLQKFYLSNGLLPRKISKVSIRFGDWIQRELLIELVELEFFTQSIEFQQGFYLDKREPRIEATCYQSNKNQLNFWLHICKSHVSKTIISRIRSCRTLEISLGSNPVMFHSNKIIAFLLQYLDSKKFLPNLLFVKHLEISCFRDFLKGYMHFTPPVVDQSFRIDFGPWKSANNHWQQRLEALCQHENLSNVEHFIINDFRESFSALTPTKAKSYTFSVDFVNLSGSITALIRQGSPGKNPDSVLVFTALIENPTSAAQGDDAFTNDDIMHFRMIATRLKHFPKIRWIDRVLGTERSIEEIRPQLFHARFKGDLKNRENFEKFQSLKSFLIGNGEEYPDLQSKVYMKMELNEGKELVMILEFGRPDDVYELWFRFYAKVFKQW